MVRKMKKLCELKDDEKVIVKYKEGMTEVIDAGEIESCIAYNEGFSLEFYTAVKDTVQINERELITKLTEMLGNDQYEDWELSLIHISISPVSHFLTVLFPTPTFSATCSKVIP